MFSVPWHLNLAENPPLFNNFISHLKDEIKCTLMKCADNTKLSAEVDILEGRATLQECLDSLEEWADKKLTKFKVNKHKVLQLGKYNPGVQHRLGCTWLGSCFLERGLGGLVHKLDKSPYQAGILGFYEIFQGICSHLGTWPW